MAVAVITTIIGGITVIIVGAEIVANEKEEKLTVLVIEMDAGTLHAAGGITIMMAVISFLCMIIFSSN